MPLPPPSGWAQLRRHRMKWAARRLRQGPEDACGCATGAWFMAIGLGLSSIYFGWQCRTGGMAASAAVLRVFLATFLAAGAGKVLGILRYRIGRNLRNTVAPPPNLDPHPTGE